jgi:hypothetical protein
VGIPLDVEEQLTHPRSPLRSVLIDSIFSARRGPSTFILNHQDESGQHLGLAQMRTRPDRPERAVVFIAPALTAGNGSHAIWQRLLTHLSIQTAERGNLRLYAGLPVDSEELQLFKNVGFIAYSQEDIYKLDPHHQSLPLTQPVLHLRPQESSDGWGLQKLYSTLTPRTVQNVEGLAQGQWALPRRRWGEQGRRQGYIWEEKGELLGAIYIRTGKYGCLMRTLLHPDAVDEAPALAQAALKLSHQVHLPVYFAVRQYEMGWSVVLPDLGFIPYTSQTLVVKPMTIRVRKEVPLRMPGLEQNPPEGATTAMSRAEFIQAETTLQNGHNH